MLIEVKDYLRITDSEEDFLLESMISAAKMYIKNSTGIAEIDEYNDLHKLAVCMLTCHWFEQREVIGKAAKLAYSLDSIMFQISFENEGNS